MSSEELLREMANDTDLIFVYGSSRKGQAHSCAESATSFVGAAAIHGYWLYELAVIGRSYAQARHPSSRQPPPLSGELYRVDPTCLAAMDKLHEVENGLYDRVRVEVSAPSGEIVQAWMYEGNKIAPTRVESGDWECKGVECGQA